MPIKVYISGQITGLDRKRAQKNFDEAEILIRNFGMEPVNPMKVCEFNPEWEWHHYMSKDIAELFQCQAIFLLDNWKVSKGARIEARIAAECGMKIFSLHSTMGKHYLVLRSLSQKCQLNSEYRFLDNGEIISYLESEGVIKDGKV